MEDKELVQLTLDYLQESREAKRERMDKNKRNFDVYHLRQDFSHKRSGQSREMLAKQTMAVEQIVSFFQQGLVDTDSWFNVTIPSGVKNPFLSENESYLILNHQLEKAKIVSFISDNIKLGLLGSLMVAKVTGKYCNYPNYYISETLEKDQVKKELRRANDKRWELSLQLVRHEDFHPDPIVRPGGKPLYVCEDIYMDINELYALAEGENKIYDYAEVEKLAKNWAEEQERKLKVARETGQTVTYSNYRGRIKITECWGNIIDKSTGKLTEENVTWTIAQDNFLIAKPKKNPFWHGEHPYVYNPIIRVPFSTWHKALMDAPTNHNIAMNELYNLLLDSGMMSAHGIKQIRTDWLDDPSQVENGIPPGTTLGVSSNCPAGMKVLERVDTATVSPHALNIYNMQNAEFNQSALTNDTRMGALSNKQVKATEIVEASQTITSVFTGMNKVIEVDHINEVLRKSWLTSLQNMDSINNGEISDLIGEKRSIEVSSASPEERFVRCATGYKFAAHGVSSVLSRMRDFRKLTSLLQTISTSDLFIEAFLKQYSPQKFLDELMRSLDINTKRIKVSEEEAIALQQSAPAPMAGTTGPNMQSNIPQASTGGNESVESRIPRANFTRGANV